MFFPSQIVDRNRSRTGDSPPARRREGGTHAWRQQRNGLFGLAAAVKRRRRIIICLVPHAPLRSKQRGKQFPPLPSKNGFARSL